MAQGLSLLDGEEQIIRSYIAQMVVFPLQTLYAVITTAGNLLGVLQGGAPVRFELLVQSLGQVYTDLMQLHLSKSDNLCLRINGNNL